MPYVLARFGFTQMMDCRRRIRALFDVDDDPATFEEAARRTVQFFYEELVDEEGKPALALVRLFKTHLFRELDADLKHFARSIAPDADSIPDLRCLTLVATAGELPEWNSRAASRGHRAIPLTSVEFIEQAPMIAQLIKQMGIPTAMVVRPDRALMLDQHDTAYNVFHVATAAGSPFIVAQKEFVERYGIASVVGFGGLFTTGDLFATILFTKVPIAPSVADLFRVVGLNLKVAILPHSRKPLFDS